MLGRIAEGKQLHTELSKVESSCQCYRKKYNISFILLTKILSKNNATMTKILE